MFNKLAPTRGQSQFTSPWEGVCNKKPWHYKVTAAIPCLDTPEQVGICVRLLQLQTERPYIVIIDTGSTPAEYAKLEKLRAEDVEVHAIRLNGVLHPSDFPAMAMDLAFTLCRTELLFATHADCFLRRRDFLEYLLNLIKLKSPVVGYEISPRCHADWRGMVSHTATMYHMPTMDRIGFGWSLRRLCNYYGMVDYRPSMTRPHWPDTEILGNYLLRQYKIKLYLIGGEPNEERKKDENIDHFRSFTSGKLYTPEYYQKAVKWYEEAKKEALERIKSWERLESTNENRDGRSI
jgi:hypothetical protein